MLETHILALIWRPRESEKIDTEVDCDHDNAVGIGKVLAFVEWSVGSSERVSTSVKEDNGGL